MILQQGSYNITATATDAHSGVSNLPFMLTVNSNNVPVITPVGNISINENAELKLCMSFHYYFGKIKLMLH